MSILHFGEHHQDSLAPKLSEFTEQYGSKGGILEFLRTFPDLREHIFPGFSISSETLRSDRIPNLPEDFRQHEKFLIYRSSHPDDHRGYIGMLPTLFSRHHKDVNSRTSYDLPDHELNMLKVFNALAYFQLSKTEQTYTKLDFSPEGIYNPYGYPRSNPGTSYEIKEEIPFQEYRDFFDIDPYGYHIDYHALYKSLLEKVKNGEDTTDYSIKASRMLRYEGWNYHEMIQKVRQAINSSRGYKEVTGLRGVEKTGIFIQPEIVPDGTPLGGMCESPHKKGIYIITFRTPTLVSDKERENPFGTYAFADSPATVIYDSNTGEVQEIEGASNGRLYFLDSIIELYKKVTIKEVFGKDYSFHMEFGFHEGKPMILQIRQFSPYQTADFTIEGGDNGKRIVRGVTDEVGEKINITLLGKASSKADINGTTNIGIKHGKVELKNNLPLRQRRVVTRTGWGRLDDDHGVTKLLYETGGVAVAGTLPGLSTDRDQDITEVYEGILFSDGLRVVIEGVKKIDVIR